MMSREWHGPEDLGTEIQSPTTVTPTQLPSRAGVRRSDGQDSKEQLSS